MPRGKAGNTNGKQNGKDENFKGFAQVLIGSDDIEEIEAWSEANPSWTALIDAIDSGYKFSLTYNVKGKSYIATLFGANENTGANYGWALSGFGNSAEQAVVAVLFKHYVRSEGGGWGGQQQSFVEKVPYR